MKKELQTKQPNQSIYNPPKLSNRELDKPESHTKDQFIVTSLTLRKLQKNEIIPSQITPININSTQIRHPKPNIGSKYLLISNKNIVYYGQLNAKGIPETHSGIFIFADGSYYEGEIKNGKPDGKGKLTNIENSYSYIGDWKKGLPDGFGKQIIDNNTYEGEFRIGKKNGKGTLRYGDGSYYQGTFVENMIHGEGKYLNKNNYWEGKWLNGYMEGQGKQIIAKNDLKDMKEIHEPNKNKENSQYIGEFVKGQKSGFGSFKWNKNYQYEGHFEKGQLHGEGTFKFKGRVYAGVWSNGTQVKISELKRGVPSLILTGNINKDGSIIMTNSKSAIYQNKEQLPKSSSSKLQNK